MTMHALLHHLPYFGPVDVALTREIRESTAEAAPEARGSAPQGTPAEVVALRPTQAPAVAPEAARARAPQPVFTRDDVDRAAAEARHAALAEAKAALAACEAARVEDARLLEQTIEARLTAARAEWTRAEAERLATQMKGAFAELDTRISTILADILTPFVGGALKARALNEMTNRLTTLLTKSGPSPTLTVSGPADLLRALRERLGHPEGIAFVERCGADLQATSDDTVIETQLNAWATALAGHDGQGGARVRHG